MIFFNNEWACPDPCIMTATKWVRRLTSEWLNLYNVHSAFRPRVIGFIALLYFHIICLGLSCRSFGSSYLHISRNNYACVLLADTRPYPLIPLKRFFGHTHLCHPFSQRTNSLQTTYRITTNINQFAISCSWGGGGFSEVKGLVSCKQAHCVFEAIF